MQDINTETFWVEASEVGVAVSYATVPPDLRKCCSAADMLDRMAMEYADGYVMAKPGEINFTLKLHLRERELVAGMYRFDGDRFGDPKTLRCVAQLAP